MGTYVRFIVPPNRAGKSMAICVSARWAAERAGTDRKDRGAARAPPVWNGMASAVPLRECLWPLTHDFERLPSVDAVCMEVAVEREDAAHLQGFGGNNQ